MERKERRHHTREFKLEAVRLAAVRDGSALTPFRWCSGFSLWESGRHKVRRSGGSFARSRTYWV